VRSGGNNFNYFPENQLTKFSARPLKPLVAIAHPHGPHPKADVAAAAASDAIQTGVTPKPQCSFFSAC